MSAGGFASPLRWAFAMNWGQRALATIFTFVLAAILGPHDFGVVAMGLVYISLVWLVLEQGLSTAVVQREELEPEHLDSAFWLNLAWCIVLTAVSISLSSWWAGVNSTPELGPVIQVLSVIIVVEGLSIVQQALLQRKLQFKQLAVRANAAALAGGVVGVVLALAGAGVWSLVAQQVVFDLVALLSIWWLSDWRPRLRFSWRHGRELLGFSGGVFVANVGGFVNRRSDALLMGIFFGPTAVGLYRLADRLVDTLFEVTTRPVGLVSLPVLSRLQTQPAELRRTVETCLRTALLAAVPTLLMLAAVSHQVLAVIGSEWTVADTTLQLLCVVGIAKAVMFISGPLLFAVSRPGFRAVMLWTLGGTSAIVVVAVGMALRDEGTQDQIVGMAFSRAALFLAVFVPISLAVISRFGNVRIRDVLSAVPAPLAAGLAGVAAVQGLEATGALDETSPIVALVVAGGLAALTTGCVLAALVPNARARARRLLRRDREEESDPPADAPDMREPASERVPELDKGRYA